MSSAGVASEKPTPVAQRSQSSGLFSRLGAWWLAEARSLAAIGRTDASVASRGERLVVAPGETDIVFSLVRTRGRSPDPLPVARAALTPRTLRTVRRKLGAGASIPLFLEPPSGLVFSHRMMLPAASVSAAPVLVADVVRRKTPLNPDQFHAAYALDPAPEAPGKMLLRIGLVPKAWVADQLKALGLTGDDMAGLLVADAAGSPLQASLAAPRRSVAGLLAGTVAVLLLAGGCAMAGWAAWTTYDEARRLDEQIARVAPRAREALAASRAAGETGALVEALRQRKEQAGLLAVWRELTQLLPTDTFVLDLQVNDREIAITGYSSSASSLIQRLEQSALLTDVALTGAVVFDSLEGKERFTMRAAFRRPQPSVESLR